MSIQPNFALKLIGYPINGQWNGSSKLVELGVISKNATSIEVLWFGTFVQLSHSLIAFNLHDEWLEIVSFWPTASPLGLLVNLCCLIHRWEKAKLHTCVFEPSIGSLTTWIVALPIIPPLPSYLAILLFENVTKPIFQSLCRLTRKDFELIFMITATTLRNKHHWEFRKKRDYVSYWGREKRYGCWAYNKVRESHKWLC